MGVSNFAYVVADTLSLSLIVRQTSRAGPFVGAVTGRANRKIDVSGIKFEVPVEVICGVGDNDRVAVIARIGEDLGVLVGAEGQGVSERRILVFFDLTKVPVAPDDYLPWLSDSLSVIREHVRPAQLASYHGPLSTTEWVREV